MEQRIGSSSQPPEGAGVDPAFIPGLTSPVSGRPADVRPEAPAEPEDAVTEDVAEAGSPDAAAPEDPPEPEDAEDAEEADAEAGEEAEAEVEDAEEEIEPPVFEAADRRARIIADHAGIQLFLDDQQCEFRWDEIGAVETETPGRFGRFFTITVHTPDNRWYPIEIEASSKAQFTDWEEQLDAVMDAYFEDEDTYDDGEEPEDEEYADEEYEGEDAYDDEEAYVDAEDAPSEPESESDSESDEDDSAVKSGNSGRSGASSRKHASSRRGRRRK